jgi:2-C-methyl-D-erythritol 2,4-cyclodiphosphate synthase
VSEGLAAMRVGWGFDAHRLDGDPPLKLGGVDVSESFGVSATSDGDVLAHAVTDALLGACALEDLGEHFPSDDPASVGTDSMVLLRRAVDMAGEAGWAAAQVDVTVVAELVKVASHRTEIRRSLAYVLRLGLDDVSVKATTTDGLGFIGRGEGIAAVAVLTVERA